MRQRIKFGLILWLITKCLLAGSNTGVLFTIPNDSKHLKINIATQKDSLSSGPTDFTVTGNLLAILDSERESLVYFDKRGQFVKRVVLPPGYYERIIRLRDGTLLAFADTVRNQTRMVHINQDSIVEEQMLDLMTGTIRSNLLVDDQGLFLEAPGVLNPSNFLGMISRDSNAFAQKAKEIMQKTHPLRVNKNCLTCKPVEAHKATVLHSQYRINFKKPFGNAPSLSIGKKTVELDQLHRHAGTHLVHIDANGSVWISEAIFLDASKIITYIWNYAPTGELLKAYIEPEMYVDDYVLNHLAIDDEGAVYYMGAQKNGLIFKELYPLSKEQLEASLGALNKTKPFEVKPKSTRHALWSRMHSNPTNSSCIPRSTMFTDGLRYLYAYLYLSERAIENDDRCKGRIKPLYLKDGEGFQFSVSYNWGGFDSVDAFIEKIETMKAGNTNTKHPPLLRCTAGVDCSGFVSRLWNLPSKWNTSDIAQNTNIILEEELQTGDVFVKPNAHVMLFSHWNNDQISTIEATAQPGKVISSQHDLKRLIQQGYRPHLAWNACTEQ
ncbi:MULTISPECIES: NlpC/P60 family protein [Fluoribacter]|uniref:hypothetical protein n=1 Tax=Fluoribacter TaxID=461 RepID=UPI00104129DE|nr:MULTISPECIES: hypothetical protein [Fluoribacter]MCW8419978.1 hypothetical protein [Fluoribacter dumoffii]